MKKFLIFTTLIVSAILFTNLTRESNAENYHFIGNAANPNEFSTENKRHNFRADFDENGVEISSFDNQFKFDWQLKSIGRAENQTILETSETVKNGNRIEIEKSQIANRKSQILLTEWFQNQTDGLEQGFIVHKKPSGVEKLRLVLTTNSIAKAIDGGQTLELSNKENGKMMRYENLKVWDAENTILNAAMSVTNSGEIFLEVEDEFAVYPVTIDPKFVQTQKITFGSSGTSPFGFGQSFAVSGNRMVVGAPDVNNRAGAAYLYTKGSSGWSQTIALSISANPGDYYGTAVAIDGDKIIISAPGRNNNRGAVFVWRINQSMLTPAQTLTAPNAVENQYFGETLAIENDKIAISLFGNAGNAQGVYIFRDPGVNAYVFRQKLVPSNSADIFTFGHSVSISGNTIAVGNRVGFLRNAPENSVGNDGRVVYVYTGTDANWTEQARITRTAASSGSVFGRSVDIDGDLMIIGEPVTGMGSNPVPGRAHVYTRNGTFWVFQQTLTAPANSGSGSYAFDVRVSNGFIAVADSNYNSGRGAVYLYNRTGGTWTQRQRLTASDAAPDQFFGFGIDFQGTNLIAAATANANNNSKPLYTFELPQTVPADFDGDRKTDVSVFRPPSGAWYLQMSTSGFGGLNFGASTDLPAAADFDGDGKTDIAVFRPSNGTWYGIFSSTNTFEAIQFGQNGDLPRPGDFDGDGIADINVFRPSNGAWYRLDSSTGNFAGVTFGQNGDKPLLADFDGDGKNDVAVFRPSTGSFYSLDSSTGLFRGAAFGFGTDIPTPGDFDGDGKTDVAVFRPSDGGWYRLNSSTGAFVGNIFGQNGDIPTTGDYDGDGRSDIAVFRTSNGAWYRLNSSNGAFVGQIFGFGTDKPIPSVFQ